MIQISGDTVANYDAVTPANQSLVNGICCLADRLRYICVGDVSSVVTAASSILDGTMWRGEKREEYCFTEPLKNKRELIFDISIQYYKFYI